MLTRVVGAHWLSLMLTIKSPISSAMLGEGAIAVGRIQRKGCWAAEMVKPGVEMMTRAGSQLDLGALPIARGSTPPPPEQCKVLASVSQAFPPPSRQC